MSTFEKDAGGKVIFTDEQGEAHGLDPSANVLSPAQKNLIFINDQTNPTHGVSVMAVSWESVTAPANPAGTRAALVRLLVRDFFNVPAGGGTVQDVNVLNDPLNTNVYTQGAVSDAQNPLHIDDDRIYASDINVADSDIGTFSGAVTDFFDSLDTVSISPAGGNPRVLKVALKATAYTSRVALGCDDPLKGFGTDITLKILGSAETVRQTINIPAADPNSQGIPIEPDFINGFILEFNTAAEVALSNIVVRTTSDVLSQLQGIGNDGFLRGVRVTPSRDLGVDVPRDLFGNLPVAEQTSVWDSTAVFGYLADLFYTDFLTGGATITHLKDESAYLFTVAAGEIAARQLKTRAKYQPLKAHKSAITFLAEREEGVEKYFGYGDLDNYDEPTVDGTIQNGVFVKVAGQNTYIQLWNNGVQTLDGGGEGIERASWNIDPLDGFGPSRITLDMSYCQIGVQEMEWLGVGSIIFYMNIKGRNIPIHQVDNANYRNQAVYMRTANLSPVWMVKGVTAGGTMKAICNAVVSGGGHNPVGVPRFVESSDTISLSGGSYQALLFIRLKPDAYEANVNVRGIDGLVESSGDANFRLLYNPTWSGDAITWADVPNSHVQVAQAATNNDITDEGIKMHPSFTSSDDDASSQSITSKLRLGKSLQANVNQEGRYDVMCLAAETFGGVEAFRGAILYEDIP